MMQEIERAKLDGKEFRTFSSQDGKRMDNSVIMTNYITSENNQVAIAYGIIQRMFTHRFWPQDDAPTKVVALADWYEQEGTNPVNTLPIVRYNANFSSCSLVFLEDCLPENSSLFPTDPFSDVHGTDTYDVIRH